MIFRLSQKLATKLKVGPLRAMPCDENHYADWSANLFTADRTLADSCGPTKGGERPFESSDTQQPSNREAPDAKRETGANTTSGLTINVPFTCAQRKSITEIVPEMSRKGSQFFGYLFPPIAADLA